MQGEELAVQVRQTHLIAVDQIDRADTAAHERLRRVAAHAADAEHRDARRLQPRHRRLAEQQLRAGKGVIHAVASREKSVHSSLSHFRLKSM